MNNEKMIQKLMIQFSNYTEFNRGDRIEAYQNYFPKRYVCENQHEPIIKGEEKDNPSCPKCGISMSLIKPHSTKHLFEDEVGKMIESFEKNPEKMRKKLNELIGLKELI